MYQNLKYSFSVFFNRTEHYAFDWFISPPEDIHYLDAHSSLFLRFECHIYIGEMFPNNNTVI